jgi:hypothetical protein
MAFARGDAHEGRATTFVRWVGGATIIVSLVVAVSLVVRSVDFNPFVIATVLVGLASGLLAVRTGRAFFPFLLLLLAAFPTIFGWYVFFYLPLLLLLVIGGIARLVTSPRRPTEARPTDTSIRGAPAR